VNFLTIVSLAKVETAMIGRRLLRVKKRPEVG
jgi:hypothetical protein